MPNAVDWTWNELATPDAATPSADPETAAAEEEARLQAALQEAYEQGFAEGRREGSDGTRRELSAAVQAAGEAVDRIREMHTHWGRNLEETLAAVAVGIARHILEREIEADPTHLAGLVRSALTRFPTDHAVRIRVHPRDLASVHTLDEGEAALAGTRKARWVADEQIQPGCFLVEGPERVVDGRIDKALERIYWSLTDG